MLMLFEIPNNKASVLPSFVLMISSFSVSQPEIKSISSEKCDSIAFPSLSENYITASSAYFTF